MKKDTNEIDWYVNHNKVCVCFVGCTGSGGSGVGMHYSDECLSVTNYHQLTCLFNSLFRLTTTKSKLCITGLLWRDPYWPCEKPVMQKTYPCQHVIILGCLNITLVRVSFWWVFQVGLVIKLTHLPPVIRVSMGSDNGSSPIRRRTIMWTSVGLLLIGPLGTNFSEILIKIRTVSFKKMRLKKSPAKWRPFCPGGDELMSCVMIFFGSIQLIAWQMPTLCM